jgi:microsomal dipeptidase-like Zn-dependent dipeptidase
MPYFDFHLHPVLKSLFSEAGGTHGKASPWKKIMASEIPVIINLCSDLEKILASQSNLEQLIVNECNLVCAAMYVPEKKLLQNTMVSKAAKGKLGKYLQQSKIDKIINGNCYKLLMEDDYDTLMNAAQFGVQDRKVKLLRQWSDYNEKDVKTIHIVFTIEGLHTLSGGFGQFDIALIKQNLDALTQQVKVFSVNITHIEQSPLCNHAYGMQFLNESEFKPTGKGLSADGEAMARYCGEKDILIDVKHMSLRAREDLYALRKGGSVDNTQPIVCTHAGFTGISKKDIPKYIYSTTKYPGKGYMKLAMAKPWVYGSYGIPSFNASSINLYDEDIKEILDSGGIIGLSMDKRILGYQDPNASEDYPYEEEFVSNAELGSFFKPGYEDKLGKAIEEGVVMTTDRIREEGGRHIRYFMAHLLHLIRIGGEAALKRVCIGSDFDGLINPIECCESMDEIWYFRQQLEDEFEQFAAHCNFDLPAGFNVKEFAENLFFRNGRDFLKGRLM